DYEEVQAGTDPLDPNDFPKDAPVGLILGLILGLGVPLGAAVLLVVLARKGKFKLPFIKKK
ncbi:MAG: thrombospondin type 3 repeat-containing protein, partial [Candidatus Heimdallarchaeaceae archaeon]